MNETRVDITNQEDGAADDVALLQAQYTRIRSLQSLSAFSDYSARVDDLPTILSYEVTPAFNIAVF